MFKILTAIAALFTAKDVIKEKAEPIAPKGTRFDWDAYWDDVDSGVGALKQVRKRQSGGYTTTEPLPHKQPPIDGVIDIKRYQHDKEVYGEAIAEINRQNGSYKYIRPF